MAKESEQVVAAVEHHVEFGAAGDVPERVGDKDLADADRSEHDDVTLRLHEAQADKLLQDAAVLGDLGSLVPALEHHVVNEPGIVCSPRRRGVAAPLDLIGKESEQEVLKRQLVVFGEGHPLGESGQYWA